MDKDGDTIMTNTPVSGSTIANKTSPFIEKLTLDWFNFDSRSLAIVNKKKESSSKSPLSSPISPPSASSFVSTRSPVSTVRKSLRFNTSELGSPVFSSASNSPSTPVDPERKLNQLTTNTIPYPPVPTKPLSWIWTCHLCRSRYPLSVTRRCLVDGHFYCSGEGTAGNATAKTVKKRRKAVASCTSEFDYVGWKEHGNWYRRIMAIDAANDAAKTGSVPEKMVLAGCNGCTFPSQCRYERKAPLEIIDSVTIVEEYLASQDDSDLSKKVEAANSKFSARIDFGAYKKKKVVMTTIDGIKPKFNKGKEKKDATPKDDKITRFYTCNKASVSDSTVSPIRSNDAGNTYTFDAGSLDTSALSLKPSSSSLTLPVKVEARDRLQSSPEGLFTPEVDGPSSIKKVRVNTKLMD